MMKLKKGFTLIELLVVVVIISILASIAIPQYTSYQRKARVSSYVLPILRGCMIDLLMYCIENPSGTIPAENVTGTNSPVRNCKGGGADGRVFSTAGGDVILGTADTDLICANDGSISGTYTINATLSGVMDYRAECTVDSYSVRCTIK